MKGPLLPRSLDGWVVVLTGFRSNEVRNQIEARGGRVASAVSGKTDVVVCAKNDLESAKATEGRERGIPVVTLDSFQAAYSMVGVSKKKKNPTQVQTDTPRASRCYFALDNGGRPFKVCHDARRFWVLKQSDPDADVDSEFTTTVVKPTPYARAFVGKSPRNKMTEFSGGHGPRFDGNSMLFELGTDGAHRRCMFVGGRVETFTVPDPIVTFVSPVGNSSVPYPFAVDRVGRVYLFIESVVMTATTGASFGTEVLRDPYDLYYDAHRITTVPRPKKRKGILASLLSSNQPDEAEDDVVPFEGITAFYIGHRRYDFTYTPFPQKDYDRIVRMHRGSKHPPATVSVVAHGKRRELTRTEYAHLMQRFGRYRGFAPLKTKVLHERVW